jgi:hypothetical protein
MKEILRLPISEARARLPELAQRVMASPRSVVIIEHRNRKERLVLTTESHLRSLEAIMENTKKNVTAFRLKGSLSSPLTDEELEAALIEARKAEAEAADRKMRGMLED